MEKKVIYLKLNQNILTEQEDVYIKEIASVYCDDEMMLSKINTIKIAHFSRKEMNQKKTVRIIVSVLKVIEEIMKIFPAVEIQNLGETDVVIEYMPKQEHRKTILWLRVALVSLICFFGTAFSIMTFHNDVGVPEVFEKIYHMLTGKISNHHTILEWSYSFGLGGGILLFYNHVGKRRLSKDPTPLEVEMRNYERDVNTTLVETADREKKTIEP